MSTSWSSPDPRRQPYATVAPDVVPGALPQETAPPVAQDAWAGLLAAVVTVLLGAPVGLLWAALAPRVDVQVQGDAVNLVNPSGSGFIAGDAAFLGAVLLAGIVGGLVAWRLARAHGPAVVAGLTVGGLLAAYVALRVGQEVGLEEVQRAVQAAQQGRLELSLRLRSTEAVAGWPVGSLLAYVGASLVRGR